MTIVMGQTRHLHGLGNLRVPREMTQQFPKVEQKNTNRIDELLAWFDACMEHGSVILQPYLVHAIYFEERS